MIDQNESSESAALREPRLERIEAICRRQRFVSVAELTKIAGVSSPTIQRDLRLLEGQGRVRRVRGGAASPATPGATEGPVLYQDRRSVNPQAKSTIAALAVALLPSAGHVFLGSGTTVLELASLMDRSGFARARFVTNSYLVARRLADEGLNHLLLPGRVLVTIESVVGEHAVACLESLRFDAAVLGFAGIDRKAGLTDSDAGEALLKERVVSRSTRVIALADRSKWGAQAGATVGPITMLDDWVTDSIDAAGRAVLRKADVRLHQPGKRKGQS
jgi:DeoR/GlpR family transcriptional regulator of sugar metabolism